ncbi:MAG: tocopherol cyclase family protein [Crocinitomicaceae bacterium]
MSVRKNFSHIIILCLFVLSLNIGNGQTLTRETNFTEHKWTPFYNLKKARNTIIFQGNKEKKNYFEGWYFKMVSSNGESILSVIPGISLSEDGKIQHAFIQLINGVTATTKYYSFPIEDFYYSKKDFAIRIGQNYFSKNGLVLNIQQGDTAITGYVTMKNLTNYSSGNFVGNSIMGWYRFVPFMECYHGVASLTHQLNGQIKIGDQLHEFNNGKGYIEKDWGSSMPSSWIWIQTNHFSKANNSLMLSIATVPFLGKSFNGFLGFFYHNGKTHRFATYENTKLNLKLITENSVEIKIENRKYSYIIEAKRHSMGLLKAPVSGTMSRRIPESIDATIKLTLLDKKGNSIYLDSTSIAGLEMVGNVNQLVGDLK